MFLFSLDKCPELDYIVVLFLIFQGNSMLFSIVAAAIYSPNNNMGFPDDSGSKESVCNAGDTGNVGLVPV